MSSGLAERDGFVLSVLPASVTYGPVTLPREEFGNEPGGLPGKHSLEDFDFILGETRSLFDKVGLDLQLDETLVRQRVSEAIWDDLWRKGDKAESTNLFLSGGNLSFSFLPKPLKRRAWIVMETLCSRMSKGSRTEFFTCSQRQENGQVCQRAAFGPSSRRRFSQSSNPKLVIRKFGGIVIRSGDRLYPDVSVMLAGAAPLGEDTLIRGVKVELGEALGEPVSE